MAKLRNLIEYITRDDVLEAAWKNAAKHLPKHCEWKAKRSMAADVAAVREMILSGAIPQRKYKPREYKEGADKKERIITPQRFFPHGIILNAMKLAIEPEIDRRLIYDTSAGLTINGKPDRCSVLYSEHSCDGPRRKFITSSALIISKLRRATEIEENEGCEIFPQETVLRQCALSGGRYTYDID